MRSTLRMRQIEALIRGYWPHRHRPLPLGGPRVWVRALRDARRQFVIEMNDFFREVYGDMRLPRDGWWPR